MRKIFKTINCIKEMQNRKIIKYKKKKLKNIEIEKIFSFGKFG